MVDLTRPGRASGPEPLAFAGAPGHSYRLFSVATDQVGNEEPVPEVPDLVLTFPPSIRITVDVSLGQSAPELAGVGSRIHGPDSGHRRRSLREPRFAGFARRG